jgi:hypothetical protein
MEAVSSRIRSSELPPESALPGCGAKKQSGDGRHLIFRGGARRGGYDGQSWWRAEMADSLSARID